MKIAWLQDIDPMTHPGGAQQNDKRHIVAGLGRGHDIDIFLPAFFNKNAFEWAEMAVLSNTTNFAAEAFTNLLRAKIPYVWFFHDFAPLCKIRLFYPMLEKCKDCFRKPQWMDSWQGASLLVWLSPLHREAWLYACPELEEMRYELVPSAIDPDRFFDMGKDRRGTVAVNATTDFKGAQAFLEWTQAHPEEPVTLVGGNPEHTVFPRNVTVLDGVPPHDMNELYNSHERFVHLPLNVGPFDRTIAEAYLAGCTVIGNKNVGALSWPFFSKGRDAVREAVRQAPETFWTAIERSLVQA